MYVMQLTMGNAEIWKMMQQDELDLWESFGVEDQQ